MHEFFRMHFSETTDSSPSVTIKQISRALHARCVLCWALLKSIIVYPLRFLLSFALHFYLFHYGEN